jgi:hypothetical protein
VPTTEILGLLALAATVVIAVFTLRSALAIERSAKVMERTHKASFASVLRVEFYFTGAMRNEQSIIPVFTEVTEEFRRLLQEWQSLPPDQAATKKHALFVSVKNLGPAAARNVSLSTKVRIVEPRVGTPFTKEMSFKVYILEVGYRQAKLVHVFDEPTSACRVGVEETRVTHMTIEGDTVTEVIPGAPGHRLDLVQTPVQQLVS